MQELILFASPLSAAPQVGFVVGFRALCLKVDNIRRYFGWKVGNQDCSIGFGNSVGRIAQSLAFTRKIGNRRGSEGLRSFNPSQGTNLLILIILAGDIEMNPGPRFQCRTCKKYCKAAEKAVKCEDCEKRFHASCVNLGPVELQKIESDNDSWYCSNCKAECSLCSGAVLNSHKAVQCDKCEMWVALGAQ